MKTQTLIEVSSGFVSAFKCISKLIGKLRKCPTLTLGRKSDNPL